MKNKILIFFIMAVMSFSSIAVFGANVYVNGKKLDSDVHIINDRIYVPLRAVNESMGADVRWDEASSSAYVEYDNDDIVKKIIKNASKSVVAVVGNYKPEFMSRQALAYNETYAHGSGVIIKNNGLILTNAHVVKDLENITVILGNGETYNAALQCIDEKSDLATIKINKLGLTPIVFGTMESVDTGSTVIAIGSPLSLNMINAASKGIISGKNISVSDAEYYMTQSDVTINSGNSGGALINMRGELIGINSAKIVGIGIEGMSFSIPIDTVNYVLNQFETNKKVIRPSLGASFSQSWEARLGLPTTNGLTVKSAGNGLSVGDILTEINNIQIHSIADYNEAVKKTYTSGTIHIKYLHNGTEYSSDITPIME